MLHMLMLDEGLNANFEHLLADGSLGDTAEHFPTSGRSSRHRHYPMRAAKLFPTPPIARTLSRSMLSSAHP